MNSGYIRNLKKYLFRIKLLVLSNHKRSNVINFFHYDGCKNFGDALNNDVLRYMGCIFNPVKSYNAELLAIGSILQNIVIDKKPFKYKKNELIDIWGSGFMQEKEYEKEYFIKNVNIHALRGEISKKRCEEILGNKLDHVSLGDPGLLLSRIFPLENTEKKYNVGIIPHYIDKESKFLKNIKLKKNNFKIIDIEENTEKIAKDICECEVILSSAMHGLIAADSYGIPNKWIRLSDRIVGGDYKFNDYYSVFNILDAKPIDLRIKTIDDYTISSIINEYAVLKHDVDEICNNLEKCFPKRI